MNASLSVGLKEAAQMLGVKQTRTVRLMIARKQIRGRRYNGRNWLVSIRSIREYVEAGQGAW